MDYPYKNVNIKENNSISIRRCAERGWGYFLFEKFSNFAQRNVNLKETCDFVLYESLGTAWWPKEIESV